MFNPPPSFFDHLADRLQLATFDTNQEHRRMVKRRRLIEAAFVNGAMREPGYVFAADGSQGPHRRNDGEAFAYHPQFEEFEVSDRLNKFKELAEKLKTGHASMDARADDLSNLLDSALSKVGAVTDKHAARLNDIVDGVHAMDDVANILSNALPNEESQG